MRPIVDRCGAAKLLGVFGAGGFAEGGELRMQEFRGEGPRQGFDGFALLRSEIGEFGLGTG